MINIVRALENNRVMKALTGLSIVEFTQLVPQFAAALHIAQLNSNPNRKRALGAGNKGKLIHPSYKLFFILMYCKVYPTYDVASVIFAVNRSKTHEWVKKYLPVLEQCLGRCAVLPARQINSVADFIQKFPNTNDIFIDGTERQIQRSMTAKSSTYSGKKKLHTRKNIVACDEKRKIMMLSKSKNGKIHDKKALDKTGLLNVLTDKLTVWVDRGFRGIEKSCKATVIMPKHKSKKHPLTDAEKSNNHAIASIRIVVEHAIGGLKRFGIMRDVFRGKNGSDDRFASVCAGLWNLHLNYI